MEELLGLCRWRLSLKYSRDPAWEDILSEGYIGALAAIRRVQVTGACSLATAATRGAAWGAMSYLRSAQNPERRFSRKGHALPFVVSLTETEEGDEEWERGDLPTLPDFADELVARIEVEDEVGAWLSHPGLSGQEREILTRVVMHEEPAALVALSLGLTQAKLATLKASALAHLREQRRCDADELDERGDRDDDLDQGRLSGGAGQRWAVAR